MTVLVALRAVGPLYAQSEGQSVFERLSTEQGLSNYSIRSLLQDRRGFLWIGTQGGLNRYDGYDFTTFLPDEYINVLYEDALGMLWVGTEAGGVYTFNPKTEQFTHYAPNPDDPGSVSSPDIRAIYEDEAGAVWIGTLGGGLNRFDRATKRFTCYRTIPGESNTLASDSVWAIIETPSEPGVLWIGTERGINRLARDTERVTPFLPDSAGPKDLIPEAVRSIYVDSSGVFWVGTDTRGLYTFRPGTGSFNQYTHNSEDPSSLSSNYVLTIYEDYQGVLWVGTHGGGLNRFNRATEQFIRFENAAGDPGSLPHNEVQAILMDRAGVLWVGTWGGGLGKLILHRERFTHYTHQRDDPNSLSHSMVSSIHEDKAGVLWVGTWGGGLNRWDRRANRFSRIPLPFTDVIAIWEDSSGVLWLGTRDNTLYRLDRATGEVTPISLPGARHPGDIVLTIYEAPSEPGVLWVGTRRKGLNRVNVRTGVIRQYLHDPTDTASLSHNYAWPVYEDHQDVLWVGTEGGGLNRFDRETETFIRYTHDEGDPNSISSDRVVAIREDNEGVLWIGTLGGGLNRFDRTSERFYHYTEQDGLPHRDIVGILTDENGQLWLSTNNGLSRFKPQVEDFFNYGVADGIQSTTFIIGASFKNSHGELFFGGVNGFNVWSPTSDEDRGPVPPIVLTDIHVFGEPLPRDSSITALEAITLDYDENYIAFEFAALDFTDPSKNQYKYKLESWEETWVDAGNQHTARYQKLAPGTYTFRVTGANSNNVWNEAGTSIRLTVTSPPWQTWWAYSLYALTLLAVVYGVDRVRRNRLEIQLKAEAAEAHARVLEQLDHMKSRFLVDISHEFRTPLLLMLGPLHDALHGAYGDVSHRLRRQLAMMQRNGARLQRLINQLLDLSKLESGRMTLRARRADLMPLLRDIVAAFALRAERRHITLQFVTSEEAAPLYFEQDKVEKIFTNLLSNAFKFTPEHGKIWVKVETPSDDYVEVTVGDTGQGIPADELPHIFDRFYQVDASTTRVHEGTGIGLALTKELVELHGGTIRVASDVGIGTTFVVRLPTGRDHLGPEDLVDEEDSTQPAEGKRTQYAASEAAYLDAVAADTPELDDDLGSPKPTAPTVLIVEDNADVRFYLRGHLAPFYHLAEATDGVEGLEKARELHPDLVISDVMMPRMDGMALCRALKQDERLNDVPVILLTAKATTDSKIEGLTLGADDYIYKSFDENAFDTEVLLARVENLIEIRRTLRHRYSGEVRVGPSEITVPSEDAVFLKQVREVVEAHMADSNFSVDWLADEVSLSRRQLLRKLKETADLSPSGFIRMMRLERAAQLLEQRAGSVAEIAYRVGFKNADHFSRLFHKVIGVPPSEYPPGP